MIKKLKAVVKGDKFKMYKFQNGEKNGSILYTVTFIELRDEKVISLHLEGGNKNRKRYSFLDWNKEVDMWTSIEAEISVCPRCGKS